MIKIDWLLYFRHRKILGFYICRERLGYLAKRQICVIARDEMRHPWMLCWYWPREDWEPWHRTWKANYYD